MSTTAFLVILATAGLAAGLVALTYLAFRNSLATLALLLAIWAATVALRDSIDLSVVVSGVRVSALDVVSVVLAAVGAARIFSDGVQNVVRGLAFALLLLLAFHVARGVAESGMEDTANAARGSLYFVSPLIYAATMPGGWDRHAWKLLAATGVLLAAIAIPYFLTEGLGSASSVIVRDGTTMRATPIRSGGALLILQAAILVPLLRWPSRQTAIYLAFGAGAVVVLLQHRTVWAAGALIVIVGCFWLARNIDREKLAYLAIGTALLLTLAVLALTQVGPFASSVESATSGDSTFNWRTQRWSELLATHDAPADLATGQPAGTRFYGGASAHNNFLDAYVRFGLPGVLCLLSLGLLLWFKRSDIGPATGLTAEAVGLLILTQFVFSIGYELDAVQGVITGIFVAGVATATARAPSGLLSTAEKRVVAANVAGTETDDARGLTASPQGSLGDRQGHRPVRDDR